MGNFSFNHSDQQDDLYQTKTAAEIKQDFDSRGNELKAIINALIDQLQNTIAGDSGAFNVKATGITGLAGNNVQTLLESLKSLSDNLQAQINSHEEDINALELAKADAIDVYTKLQLFTKTELQNTASENSGASLIGVSSITGVIGNTIQTALQSLKALIDTNTSGLKTHKEAIELDHPDGSVTTRKIGNRSVSREKIATGAVGTNELDPSILQEPTTAFGVQAKLQQIDEQLAEKAKETTSKELKAFGDGLTDDSAILNAYLNSGEDRFLFLNQGKHLLNQTLLINQPNTIIKGNSYSRNSNPTRLRKSSLFANHSGDMIKIDVPSSENGVFIENVSLYGNDLAANGLVVGNYDFQGSTFENIHVANVIDTAYVLEGNNYATYYEKLFSMNSKVGISIRGGNTHNVTFEGCHIYSKETGLDILTTFDTLLNTSKLIVFKNCDFTHLNAGEVEQILIKTGKCNNVIFEACYFESPQTNHKDYLFELGTVDSVSSRVKFKDCHFSASNFDYYFKLTNTLYPIIENCYFESLPNKAYFKASTDTNDTKISNMQGSFKAEISGALPLIGTDDGLTPLSIEKVFVQFINISNISNPHQVGGYRVKEHSSDNYVFKGYDKDTTAFPVEKVKVTKDGIVFGNGTNSPNVGFYRQSTGELLFSGDPWIQGRWNLSPLRINNAWLWVDGSNNLRLKKSTKPANETDGNVILSDYATSISSAPLYVGQEALVSGVWYKAVGTSSTADWKQIS